jgi:MFS family permease
MTVTTPTIQPYEDPTIRGRRWWILAVLCLSVVIVTVGNSSLNVTIPTLSRELGASESQLQWVITAYALVFACLLFTTGALGDRFGRKGALQLGFVIFVTGSALASTADAMWQLIACRGLMGLGAAFIMPSTLSILINVFAPHERPRAIAIWASVVGVAGIFGPVTSGFLIEHFWWGAIFLINVPICLIALVAGSIVLPKSRDPEEAPFDPGGAVLSIVGIGLVVFGLIEAPETGWTAPATLAAIGGGFVVLGIFAAWERRVRNPMLDVRYFRNRGFSAGTGVIVLTFVAMNGMTFLLTQYFQLVRGFSPIEAALAMMPAAAMVLVFSPLSPKLCARIGDNRTVANQAARDEKASSSNSKSKGNNGLGNGEDGAPPGGPDAGPPSPPNDVAILQSLPGVGIKNMSAFLTEAWGLLTARDYDRLRGVTGVAPVRRQTGRNKKGAISMRYACNPRLRNACYHMANVGMQRDAAAGQYYAELRGRGHSHGRALRSVADRWLRILMAMLNSGTLYDPTHFTVASNGAGQLAPAQ